MPSILDRDELGCNLEFLSSHDDSASGAIRHKAIGAPLLAQRQNEAERAALAVAGGEEADRAYFAADHRLTLPCGDRKSLPSEVVEEQRKSLFRRILQFRHAIDLMSHSDYGVCHKSECG